MEILNEQIFQFRNLFIKNFTYYICTYRLIGFYFQFLYVHKYNYTEYKNNIPIEVSAKIKNILQLN